MLSEAIVIAGRAAVLFAAALVFLQLHRSAPAQIRHRACSTAMGISLLLPLFFFLRDSPEVKIRVLEAFDVGQIRIAGAPHWAPGQWAALVWACGFAFVTMRFLIGVAIMRRLRRGAAPTEYDSRAVTAPVNVPMAAGIFRPAILLPGDFAAWPEGRRDAALRHEIAHLERGDLSANAFGAAACAVYWFLPLVWMLYRKMRSEAEAACDDRVLEQGFDRATYAEALIGVGTAAFPHRTFVPGYPMAGGGSVKERVVRILAPRETPAPKMLTRWRLVIAAAGILLWSGANMVGREKIYTVGGAVTSPVVLRTTSPFYTDAAKAAKIRGTVQLSMVVGDNGVPRNVVVTRGIDPGLDRNAVAAVRTWKLRPAMQNRTPVSVRARVDVNFRLK